MWFVYCLLVVFCLVLLAINTIGAIMLCLSVGAVLTTGDWLYGLGVIGGLWLMMISE